MAEWLRPGLWKVLMLSRGIKPGQVLTFQKAHKGGLVLKLRLLVTVADVSQIWGQDGQVDKAGALGDTHNSVAWDQTWSSPDSKKVHIGRCVGFNHVRNSIWQA